MTSWVLMLCVGLVPLLVYRLTMPSSITLEDAGLFQMVCQLGGISHPPGYPLFTSICQIVLPPFGPGVLAGNMLSAVFAAAASMVIYSCIQQLTSSMNTAVVASLAYAFSATFWSQAIIIEVYTFAVLGFAVCWRILLAYIANGNLRYIYIASFVYGLCLSNHWPLMVLSTPALAIGLWPRAGELLSHLKRPSVWIIIVLCLAAGLLPYLTILLTRSPEIALIGEITSVSELIPYFLRSNYDVIDNQLVAGVSDKLGYLAWLTGESARQLGYMSLPVLLLGVYVGWDRLPKWVTLQLITLLLGTTFLLTMLLNFSNEPIYHSIFKPYPIIAYLPLAVWFALGLTFLLAQLRNPTLKIVASGIALLSVGLGNLAENNRHDDKWVAQHGVQVLESLPRNAIYLASDEFEIGVLGYLHKVVGLRPDIELRSPDNQFFNNRLVQPFTSIEGQTEALRNYLVGTERPFFASSMEMEPSESWGGYHRGGPPPLTSVVRNPPMDIAADRLLDLYDHHSKLSAIEFNIVFQRLVQFTRQYVRLVLTSTRLTEAELRRLERLQATYPGRLATLDILLRTIQPGVKPVLHDIAMAGLSDIPWQATRMSRALMYEFAGHVALLPPANEKAAKAFFDESIRVYPVDSNKSFTALTQLDQ